MLEEKTSVITVLFILMITLCIVDFDCLDIADNLPTPDTDIAVTHSHCQHARHTDKIEKKIEKSKVSNFANSAVFNKS